MCLQLNSNNLFNSRKLSHRAVGVYSRLTRYQLIWQMKALMLSILLLVESPGAVGPCAQPQAASQSFWTGFFCSHRLQSTKHSIGTCVCTCEDAWTLDSFYHVLLFTSSAPKQPPEEILMDKMDNAMHSLFKSKSNLLSELASVGTASKGEEKCLYFWQHVLSWD